MPYAYEPFDLMVMGTVELMDDNDKLKLENAKLRELCASARKLLVHADWQSVEYDEMASKYVRLADELGVEAK